MRTAPWTLALGLACTGSPPGDPTTTDEPGPLQLVSLGIDDGARTVSVLQTFSVTLQGRLDPDSAIAAHAYVEDGAYGFVVDAQVDWDPGSGTLRVDPRLALTPGRAYRLVVDQLADVDGTLVPRAQAAFTTAFNLWVRDDAYTGGARVRSAVSDIDLVRGRLLGTTSYSGPGDDAEWETPDDVIANVRVETWDDEAATRWSVLYDGPGVDGIWATPDDDVASQLRYLMDDQDAIVRVDVLDAYEDPVAVQILNRDDRGRLVEVIRIEGPGDDGIWVTEDDAVSGRTLYTVDDEGTAVEVVSTDATGAVTTWAGGAFGDDDTRHYVRYDDAGPDGRWQTEDDEVSSCILQTRTGDGLLVSDATFSGPGDDGTWLTEDDLQSSLVVRDRDDDGNITTSTRSGAAGPDGRWDTNDDEVASITTYVAF